MLVPATAEDLKKHGQISINPKTEGEANAEEGEDKENIDPAKNQENIKDEPLSE